MPSPAVLLVQLGTPDEPTVPALRRYLRQFLSDPRVIEVPRIPWWLILHLRILRTRPAESAAKYQRIWRDTGSPLLSITKRQTDALQKLLPDVVVRFGMQVGNPPVADVIHELIEPGTERLIVLPMYPQYSAPSTASAYDCVFKALLKERRVPALRIVPPYYDHPAYLDAMTAVIHDDLKKLSWQPDHYLLSFHGIPIKYAERGDPYPQHVKCTTRLLLERLNWPAGKWTQTFQSRFGRDPWLQPYTDETVKSLARRGVKKIYVATPGFTTDCLETLDEIGFEVRELFRHAGGEELHLCPCLNDHPRWIEALKAIVLQEATGWM